MKKKNEREGALEMKKKEWEKGRGLWMWEIRGVEWAGERVGRVVGEGK